jgi:purine-binding chemotaxis protein CheW
MAVDKTKQQADPAARAGLYLTFFLSDETYGIEILKVQEIISMQEVTQVPRVPDYIRGVINLRGKVIPIIELRVKFGMEPIEDTARTCIVVVQVATGDHEVTMGVIVDDVRDVVDIPADCIDPPPAFGASVNTEFIFGMGKLEDRVVMLLEVDEVLSIDELGALADNAGDAAE